MRDVWERPSPWPSPRRGEGSRVKLWIPALVGTRVGIPFGLGASGGFRQFIINLQSHWAPIVQALANGTLDNKLLSPKDQASLQSDNIPLGLAWLSFFLAQSHPKNI